MIKIPQQHIENFKEFYFQRIKQLRASIEIIEAEIEEISKVLNDIKKIEENQEIEHPLHGDE